MFLFLRQINYWIELFFLFSENLFCRRLFFRQSTRLLIFYFKWGRRWSLFFLGFTPILIEPTLRSVLPNPGNALFNPAFWLLFQFRFIVRAGYNFNSLKIGVFRPFLLSFSHLFHFIFLLFLIIVPISGLSKTIIDENDVFTYLRSFPFFDCRMKDSLLNLRCLFFAA